MSEAQETSSVVERMLVLQGGDSDIHLNQSLAPGATFKVSFYTSAGEAAVGILDVVHQTPTIRGKGSSIISWQETLEWGPSPTSPTDSWQKTWTIVNHSGSKQDLTIRFFFLDRSKAVSAAGDPGVHIDITGVQNQCHDGVSSVMLNNQSVVKYRITVLKRREYDEKIIHVLEPHTWTWIGCSDDGYSYSISELVRL
jgi:hypothetical protein